MLFFLFYEKIRQKMEFLTHSLKKVISTLSENQVEEIDVIESVINVNANNKEETLEKVFSFLEKYGFESRIMLIFSCIDLASLTRPK